MEKGKMTYEEVFTLGVAAGIQQMQNKIREHCKNGKPLLIGDDLYFIKDSGQHLLEVMDSIDKEYGI